MTYFDLSSLSLFLFHVQFLIVQLVLVWPQVANLIISQLLFLEAEDSERDAYLYINSPGGSVTAGLAIYDTMQFLKINVSS